MGCIHSRAEPNHWMVLWVQKWCSHRRVWCTCGFSAVVFMILPQITENSEAKPSKMHIDYVNDAAVDTWRTSSDSEEDE